MREIASSRADGWNRLIRTLEGPDVHAHSVPVVVDDLLVKAFSRQIAVGVVPFGREGLDGKDDVARRGPLGCRWRTRSSRLATERTKCCRSGVFHASGVHGERGRATMGRWSGVAGRSDGRRRNGQGQIIMPDHKLIKD